MASSASSFIRGELAAQGQVLNGKGLLAAKQEAEKTKQTQDESRHRLD
jgi:hypothetical protein